MAQIKEIRDPHGVLHEAAKILPDESHKLAMLEALAELEDEGSHRSRCFPKTRLHKVVGIRERVYRADIRKTSGWRLNVQYVDGATEGGHLLLNDVLEAKDHDAVIRLIKKKKHRYVSPR
jgi:hypothetical protein